MNVLLMRMPAMYARCLKDTFLLLVHLLPLLAIFMAVTRGCWPVTT